jgi:hydroxyacylglutathione hydrolase
MEYSVVALDPFSEIAPGGLDPSMPAGLADRLEDYRIGLSRLTAVAGVRQVVPGHGHVGDADEFRQRLTADCAYLDLLERGEPSGDSRITGDARAFHEEQLRYFQRL